MNKSVTGLSLILTAAAAVSVAALASFASLVYADLPATAAQWQDRGSIAYYEITSTYSCTAIEGKVQQILLTLGARKNMSVNATGCNGNDMPAGNAMTVNIRVFSLAPVDSTATAPGAVPPVMASWSTVNIDGQRPSFMEDGDCELVAAT